MEIGRRHNQKGRDRGVIVYMLENQINEKVYIGQTRHYRLSKRWNTRPCVHKANPHMANAIRKYGADNFSRKILCYASCQEELNLLERFWIAVFQSTDRRYGYNKTTGGQPAQVFTKEVRAAVSKANREAWRRGVHRNHAEAMKRWWRNLSAGECRLIRLRISLARSGQTIKGHSPWNKGKRGIPSGRKGRKFGRQKNPCRQFPKFSEEHKRKISQALRRYHRQRRRKEKD
jgi:group I intron endonuclease